MESLRVFLHGFFEDQHKLTGGYGRWDTNDLLGCFYRVGRVKRIDNTDDIAETHPLFIF